MAAEERAWSSGRVLTAAQRKKKRALDRERSARRRHSTTSRIQSLEARLKALETTNGFEGGLFDAFPESEPSPELDTFDCQTHNASHLDPEIASAAWGGSSDCQSIFNEALQVACSTSRFDVCTDALRNEDAIVRGIMHGWDEVVARNPDFCPLWAIIRLLDSRIFRLSGTVTRFCTLSMTHSMLLFCASASGLQSLPAWYRPRPTQRSIAHAPAVDVLPWPGLRERAVLDPTLTLSNKFWSDVIYCFRFCWPYDEAEAIKVDPRTKLFGFTGKFQNSVRDIHKWTMDESFFAAFPDTYEDIVPAPPLEWPLVGRWQSQTDNNISPCLLPLPKAENELNCCRKQTRIMCLEAGKLTTK